jgi:hypothetical protein
MALFNLALNRWMQERWFLKRGYRTTLAITILATIPEFQGILNPNSSTGSFDATLDGNSLCHISYHPSKTFPALENEVTVTWYPGTSNNRVEKWSLVFLRNKNNTTLIKKQKKCVSSFNFEHETTIEMTQSNQSDNRQIPAMNSKQKLQTMRNLLEL